MACDRLLLSASLLSCLKVISSVMYSSHILAALLHHFWHKDNVLRRMLPLLLLGIIALPIHAKAEVNLAPWNILKEQSSLRFTATQNNAPVTGKFPDFTGEILFDKEHLDESRIAITVNVTNIEATMAEVSATLTTPDWFNAALFPQAQFKADNFTKAENGDFIPWLPIGDGNERAPCRSIRRRRDRRPRCPRSRGRRRPWRWSRGSWSGGPVPCRDAGRP